MFKLDPLAMFGMPGPFELLFIGLVVCIPVAVAVSLIVATSMKRRPGAGMPGSGSLVPCPDCHHAVSSRAETCPHCGAPLKPMA